MAIDINALDFLTTKSTKDMTVGQIGYGYIGRAVEALFKDRCKEMLVYDKFQTETQTLLKVVGESDVIFVAVPTPMKPSGECHTAIVEDVLTDVIAAAIQVGRSLNDFIVVLKSTVPPGFTRRMLNKHTGLRLVFSPEFLTEANAIMDFLTINRVILGTPREDNAAVVYKLFEGVWPDSIAEGAVNIVMCDPEVAELAKLFTNGLLMTKVLFCNEMYAVCQKLNVNYTEVRDVACFDVRLGLSHTNVPGYGGLLGAGGSCFPKDINNLRFICEQLGIPERMFTAVIERNNEVRPEKDWERLKGRAVVE